MFRASGSAGEVTGGGGGLSSRTIMEEQAFYDLTFKHFKESKVEISSAITKSYPFLEILRDRDFISEQKYKRLRKKCENLVQMNRVIYDFLSDLEKVFSQSLLRVMFSQRNLKEYPGLMKILRSFPVEAQQKISTQPSHEQDHRGDNLEVWGGASHDTLKSPPRSIPVMRDDSQEPNDRKVPKAAPSTPSNKKDHRGASLEVWGGACHDTLKSAPRSRPEHKDAGLNVCKGAHKEAFSSTTRSKPDHRGASLEVWGGACRDNLKSTPRSRPVSCGPGTSQMNVEDAGVGPSELQRNGGGAERSASGNEKCSCVMCAPRCMQEDPEARTGSRQKDTVDAGNSSTLRKPKRKRRIRKCRIDTVKLHDELLPVTCGEMKGILYKEILKQGISVKCIQSEDGEWFTPHEFEIRGGYARSKNWRLSVRCHKIPLKQLIERKCLPDPSGKCRRKLQPRKQKS